KSAGARLYRTGDVVRHLPSGELEFVGRSDTQVKVRGFRIELGEIEAVLSAQAEVRECVVLAREDVPENVRLVAYLVAAKRDEEAMPVTEMRARLGERLPEYMIPSAFVWIEEMPLTPNGKVDRKALLAIKVEGGGRAREYEGARNEVEELLARVWQEALGLERVGIHDNFFELGGDSILSIQIVGKAKRAGLSLQV